MIPNATGYHSALGNIQGNTGNTVREEIHSNCTECQKQESDAANSSSGHEITA